jgi:hypothetical protein
MLPSALSPLNTDLKFTYQSEPHREQSARPPQSLILLREVVVACTSSAELHSRQESVLPHLATVQQANSQGLGG